MVTLAKIAKESGFSIPVVSRALSPKQHKDTRMADSTRSHIQDVARRLGYRPNRVAEFMKRGQSPVIGCFLPERADSLLARLMKGISEEAAENHFPVTFYFDTSKESYVDFLNESRKNKNCGIITYPYFKSHPDAEETLRRYRDDNGKIVLIEGESRNWRWGDAVSVSTDDYAGGKLAAEHLLLNDVRHFFTSTYTHIPERVEGFGKALKFHSKEVVVFDEANISEIIYGIKKSLNKFPGDKIGIFAPQDPVGIPLLCELLSNGINVGKDVLLISFDGLHSTGLTKPALTVVEQPFHEIGALAVRKLISLIYDKKTYSETIHPNLIERETA
jgi:LacI family transcriptional regulator